MYLSIIRGFQITYVCSDSGGLSAISAPVFKNKNFCFKLNTKILFGIKIMHQILVKKSYELFRKTKACQIRQ